MGQREEARKAPLEWWQPPRPHFLSCQGAKLQCSTQGEVCLLHIGFNRLQHFTGQQSYVKSHFSGVEGHKGERREQLSLVLSWSFQLSLDQKPLVLFGVHFLTSRVKADQRFLVQRQLPSAHSGKAGEETGVVMIWM